MTSPPDAGTGSSEIDALMLEYTCCVHADAKAGQYDNSQAEALLALRATIAAVVKERDALKEANAHWHTRVTYLLDQRDAAISAGKRGEGDGS